MSISSIIDRIIGIASPKWAFERQAYRNAINAASTSYAGASRSTRRNDWNPAAGYSTVPEYERATLRDRSQDANRNDPLAKSITGTYSTNIAGTGLQFQSKLRADRLGISEDQAEQFRREIEDGFDTFCKTCDAGNRLSFDDIQLLAVSKIVEDGESLIIPVWRELEWKKFGRALQMVESSRLGFSKSNAQKLANGAINDTGIIIGDFGEPLSYSIRKANSLTEFETIDARDPEGRPNVIHLFRTEQPGQIRGIPLLSPVLTLLKDFSGVMESTVMRARVAACLSVIFTHGNPIGAMLGNATGALDAKKTPDSRIEELFPGMIGHLNHGDTATMLDPAPDGNSFDPFVAVVIKLVCACVGLPYELVVKDFSKTNYSSARAAILEGRRTFTNWRKWIGRSCCQPIFELVLEEMVLRDMIRIPRFFENRDEYSRGIWIGGGWGWIDPVKEIEASNMAIESGLSTLADECAGNGKDWEENLDQRKREIPVEKEAGVIRGNPPSNPIQDQGANVLQPSNASARRGAILAEAYKGAE